jgi:Nucleotidyltransferase domain
MDKTQRYDKLYQREYPKLQQQLERLVMLAESHDANIAMIVLFGSTARLEPGPESDADILLLLHDQAGFFTGSERGHTPEALAGSSLITMAYQGDRPVEDPGQLSDWPIVATISDEAASDLDSDFLANLERDGVELYRQPRYLPPSQLTRLKSWDEWQDDVKKMLAAV